jgi:poly(ADP-ribose) glycohydrolase ARH3
MIRPGEPSMADRFRGCILGQAVGDALGAPFETMPADAIYYGFGSARKILAAPPVDRLEYTDDTQMMIGVAETLAQYGEIKQDELMREFVANFDAARLWLGHASHHRSCRCRRRLEDTLGIHFSRRVAW